MRVSGAALPRYRGIAPTQERPRTSRPGPYAVDGSVGCRLAPPLDVGFHRVRSHHAVAAVGAVPVGALRPVPAGVDRAAHRVWAVGVAGDAEALDDLADRQPRLVGHAYPP